MPSSMTPNMGLTLPTVGLEQGPAYATEINNDMTVVDSHDHSPGSGVQITPTGISINSDLSFLQNNAILLRSVRFQPQSGPLSGPSDLGCIYENGVDLFYNDGNGNQIRLTQAGSIAGTSGAITGLVSPASASYIVGSKTFVWQSDVNKAANLDAGSVIIRKLTTLSPGITLAPPSGLSADYTLTLPIAPPSQNSVLVMDSSGNVSATANPVDLDITGTLTATNADITNLTVGAGGIISGGGVELTSGNLNVDAGDISASGNIIGGGDLFPTTVSNASLVAADPNGIYVKNTTSAVGRPIVVGDATGVTYTLILAGSVNSSGTRVNGGNFTSVRNSTGNYTVTYGAGVFDGINVPVVVASSANGVHLGSVVSIPSSSTTGFTVNTDGNDNGFNFIAYGGRGD